MGGRDPGDADRQLADASIFAEVSRHELGQLAGCRDRSRRRGLGAQLGHDLDRDAPADQVGGVRVVRRSM